MIELIARLLRQRFFTAKYVPLNETPEFQEQEREIAEWRAKRDEVSAKLQTDIATIVKLVQDQAEEIERLNAALAKYEPGDQT